MAGRSLLFLWHLAHSRSSVHDCKCCLGGLPSLLGGSRPADPWVELAPGGGGGKGAWIVREAVDGHGVEVGEAAGGLEGGGARGAAEADLERPGAQL